MYLTRALLNTKLRATLPSPLQLLTRTQHSMTNSSITYTPLHPTFMAEVSGIDWTNLTPSLAAELKSGLAKYGVLVFRSTPLDDDTHVALARLLGPLDDVTPYNKLGRINRLKYDELFDVSNVDAQGNVIQPGSERWLMGKGNQLFHVDSAFNPRRAGYSLLLAHELPPRGTGGNTEFADTRTAYDDLPEVVKERVKDYVIWHSQFHSRRKASPGHPLLDQERVRLFRGVGGREELTTVPPGIASVWATQARPDPRAIWPDGKCPAVLAREEQQPVIARSG